MRLFRRRSAEPRLGQTSPMPPAEQRAEEQEVVQKPPPRPQGPGPLWPWLLLLLVVVVAGLGVLYVLGRDDEEEDGGEATRIATVETTGSPGRAVEGTAEVEVPKVVGLPVSRAVAVLGDAGFEARPRGVFSDEPLARRGRSKGRWSPSTRVLERA